MSDDVPNDDALYAAIGRLTVAWATLEAGLDAMVAFIFHELKNPPGEVEVPRSLSRKLRYLKAAYRRLPMNPDTLNVFIKVFDDISAESDTRDDVIHGFLVEHQEGENTAQALRLIHENNLWQVREIKLSVASILEAVARTNALSYYPLRLVQRLQQEIYEPREPTDEQTQ